MLKQTVLKRFTGLKARTGLKPKSGKQKIRDKEWSQAKLIRRGEIESRYDYVLCEYCGRPPWENELGILDGHHMDNNRRNNLPSNCYICHRVCHSKITDNNIKVKHFGFEGLKDGGFDDD